MTTFTIIDFCEKYAIKWFPISLTVVRQTDYNEGSKTIENINHPFYKGITQKETPTYKPIMTDFNFLSEDALKQRQSLLYMPGMIQKYNLNCIAMDTSEYYHIDVDAKDHDEQYDEMRAIYPSFPSMRKPYGFHIVCRSSDQWKPSKNRLQFKDDKGVELLCGQWSFCPFYIDNHEADICELEDMENLLVIEPVKIPKSPTTITQGINSDDDAPTRNVRQQNKTIKYEEIEAHCDNLSVDKYLTTGKYDVWICIVWSLRSLGDDYLPIAEKLAKRCGRDIKTYVETYWRNYNSSKGVNIGTLFYYSKKSDPIRYRELKMEFSSSIEQKIYRELNLDNMIKTACESDFADIFYNTFKDELMLIRANLYIYFENEWRIEAANKAEGILLKVVNEWTKTYMGCCFTYMGQQKALVVDNPDLLKEYAELDKGLLKTTQGIKRINFCRNVAAFVKSKLSCVFYKKEFDIGVQDHYNLHFKNGVLEIKNNIFRDRCYYDYVTQWLDYDYIKPNMIKKEVSSDVEDFYNKIQPDEEQRRFTLEYLALCLTANVSHQKFKMNVGYSAQNGKSTEIAIHEKVLPIYTKKLKGDTFVLGYAKRHKHIISLLSNPIRMAYVEELPEKKLDIEFVKDFVDGRKLECEVMFGTEEQHSIQAKLMTCSNNDFNGKTDEGIKRRGLIQHYTCKFLEDDGINVLDDSKHIYKKIKGYEDKFDCPYYKSAYIHLLMKYVGVFNPPDLNTRKFVEICEENDTFKNKLYDAYVFTGSETDCVFWKDICLLFGSQSGKEDRKMISNDMNRLNVKYNKDYSFGVGRKGGYVGLKEIFERS